MCCMRNAVWVIKTVLMSGLCRHDPVWNLENNGSNDRPLSHWESDFGVSGWVGEWVREGGSEGGSKAEEPRI